MLAIDNSRRNLSVTFKKKFMEPRVMNNGYLDEFKLNFFNFLAVKPVVNFLIKTFL
jgi:hypothetical protein